MMKTYYSFGLMVNPIYLFSLCYNNEVVYNNKNKA